MQHFRSLGIDDVYFVLRLRPNQLDQLFSLCPAPGWVDDEWQLFFGTRKLPKITLKREASTLIVKINIPKIAWNHNVRLAGPKEIRKAIRWFKEFADINLDQAEVLQVDVCYCESREESIHSILSLFTCPKGFELIDFENGCYFNSKKGRVTFSPYDKAEHLKKIGLGIPRDVLAECESLHPQLHRFELRIGNDETGRTVRAELKRLKLWQSPYFLGSDLYSDNGFNALVRYYERLVLDHVLLLPKVRPQRTPKSLSTIKSRVALSHLDVTEPERYLEYAEALHRVGQIGDEVFGETLVEVERLHYWMRIRRLKESIHELCEEIFAAHPVIVQKERAPIIGRISI